MFAPKIQYLHHHHHGQRHRRVGVILLIIIIIVVVVIVDIVIVVVVYDFCVRREPNIIIVSISIYSSFEPLSLNRTPRTTVYAIQELQ